MAIIIINKIARKKWKKKKKLCVCNDKKVLLNNQ